MYQCAFTYFKNYLLVYIINLNHKIINKVPAINITHDKSELKVNKWLLEIMTMNNDTTTVIVIAKITVNNALIHNLINYSP
jgi:hypothetical protein